MIKMKSTILSSFMPQFTALSLLGETVCADPSDNVGSVNNFLKLSFWHFPSEYNTSNENQQFWPSKEDSLGGQFSP